MGIIPQTVQADTSFPVVVSEGEREFIDLLKQVQEDFIKTFIYICEEINGKIEFGTPTPELDDAGTIRNGTISNIRGSWVTVTIDTAAELGTGVSSPISCVHNLNVPTSTVAGGVATVTQLNVRWFLWSWAYGDFTGAVANPAAVANAAHVSCHYSVGDAVNANDIELRFHSDIVPTAETGPLRVDLFFIPAET